MDDEIEAAQAALKAIISSIVAGVKFPSNFSVRVDVTASVELTIETETVEEVK